MSIHPTNSGQPTDPSGHPDTQALELIATGASSDEAALLHAAECPICQAAIAEIEANNKFLSNMLSVARSVAATDAAKTPLAQQPGIPGYEILGEIHRGGQGVVFRARQIATKREVAIKMPLAGSFVSAKAKARFEREIELVAQMQHPNIVTVHDSGLTPDGRYYIVMELIDGLTLDKFISAGSEQSTQTGRRRTAFILRLFAKIANALSHAHARGVVHRDIKPGNVIVDGRGEPHVVDFGLARRGEWNPESSPTLVDEFQGTPAYASPEQVGGDPRAIDIRTDIYSLGVMLYRSLTGHWPYAVDGSLSDQIRNIKHTLPLAPSRRTRFIDPDVDTIVLTSLAKESERRYQSASALESDISAYLAGQPISARRASVWYVLRKAAGRRKALSVAIAAITIAAGASFVAWQAVQQADLRIATAQATAQSAAAHLSQRLLSQIATASGGALQQGFARRILDAAAIDLDNGLSSDQPLTYAALRRQLGLMYAQLDQHSAALHQFQASLAALERWTDAPRHELAQLRMLMSREQQQLGRFRDAADMARQAISGSDNSTLEGQSQRLQAHADLLGALVRTDVTGADQSLADDAIANARRELNAYPRASAASRAALHTVLAQMALARSGNSQAQADADAAVALAQTGAGVEPQVAANAVAVLCRVHAAKGEFPQAMASIASQARAMSGDRWAWASQVLAALAQPCDAAATDAATRAVWVQHVDDACAVLIAVARDDERATGLLAAAAGQSADRLRLGERTAELASAAAGVMYKTPGPGSPERIRALQLAAAGYKRSGNNQAELASLRAAVEATDLSIKPERSLQIDLLNRLYKRSDELGDLTGALAAATRSANASTASNDIRGALKTLFERARLLERSGNFEAAAAETAQCIWLARERHEIQLLAELHLYQAWLADLRDLPGAAAVSLIEGDAHLARVENPDRIIVHVLNANRAPVLRRLGYGDECTRILDAAANGTLETLGPKINVTRRVLEQAILNAELTGNRARASELRHRLAE